MPRASSTMPNRESMAATVIQVRETVTEGFHPPRLSGTHRLGAQADFTLGLVPWMIHPLLLRMRASLRLRKRTAPATWFLSLYSKPRRPALMSIPNLRSSPIRVEHDFVVTAKAMLSAVLLLLPVKESCLADATKRRGGCTTLRGACSAGLRVPGGLHPRVGSLDRPSVVRELLDLVQCQLDHSTCVPAALVEEQAIAGALSVADDAVAVVQLPLREAPDACWLFWVLRSAGRHAGAILASENGGELAPVGAVDPDRALTGQFHVRVEHGRVVGGRKGLESVERRDLIRAIRRQDVGPSDDDASPEDLDARSERLDRGVGFFLDLPSILLDVGEEEGNRVPRNARNLEPHLPTACAEDGVELPEARPMSCH